MPFDNIGQCPYCGECNTMNHSCSGRIYDVKDIAQLLGLKFGPNKCDDEENLDENLKKLIHDMATSMENMVVWGQWINRKRSPRMDEPNSGAILECIEMLNKYKKYIEEGKI